MPFVNHMPSVSHGLHVFKKGGKIVSYSKIVQTLFPNQKRQTPQTEPLPGQVLNHAGGYYYPIDDWGLLNRFLVLGTESGTYYTTPLILPLFS